MKIDKDALRDAKEKERANQFPRGDVSGPIKESVKKKSTRKRDSNTSSPKTIQKSRRGSGTKKAK